MGMDNATTVALVRLGIDLAGEAMGAIAARRQAAMTDEQILERVRRLKVRGAHVLIAEGAAAAGAGEVGEDDDGGDDEG